MPKTRSATTTASEPDVVSSGTAFTVSTSNGLGAANTTIPATQLAFNTSHVVILQELLAMRRTLEGISRRQEANDETTRASETMMQELQTIPKRLDDMGFELNIHYSSAEDKIHRQEVELRDLADKFVRSDEERLALARKVEQLSTKISLQAMQADSQDLVQVESRGKEIDTPSVWEPEEQPISRTIVSNRPRTAVNPPLVPTTRKSKVAYSRSHKRRIVDFRRYKQASVNSYRRAPPKNGTDMKRFINHFLEGIEDKGIANILQKRLLQRFPRTVREAKTKKGSRTIVLEGSLQWNDVCLAMDSTELQEVENED